MNINVIYDQNNQLYVMCWTENNTIFLTDDLFKLEKYKSFQDATSMLERIEDAECIFLKDSNDSEVSNVCLQAGTLNLTTKFMITVYPEHPAWSAIDDDDWNGATFGQWLRSLTNCDVILCPSSNHSEELVIRMADTIKRCAKSVFIALKQS